MNFNSLHPCKSRRRRGVFAEEKEEEGRDRGDTTESLNADGFVRC